MAKQLTEILIAFLGYLLLTFGLYAIYYGFFRQDREEKNPEIFKKKWFKITLLLASILSVFLGWIIVSR